MKPSAGNEPARQGDSESEAHVGASSPAGISRLKALPIPWGRAAEGITSGLVIGLIQVLDVVSFGALIFSGRISGAVGQGIGLMLLGCMGTILVISLLGSFSGSLPVVQDAPTAVIVVIAAGVMKSLPAAVPQREVFLTVAAAVAVSALLTGLVFWLLGQFHLGALIRYLPYPVIGGFLAGTGWLLLMGGIGMMAGEPVRLTGLAALAQPAMLVRWLPGLLLGLGMLAALNRFNHFLVIPGMVLGGALLFFAAARANGLGLAQLTAGGWLLGPLPAGMLWQAPSLLFPGQIHWDSILAQGGSLLTVALVSSVSLLLNISGIEISVGQDLDLHRELKAVGFGNLLSGLLGGSVNYHALSSTQLNHRMGHDSRLTGWINILLFVVFLFIGASILNIVPKMILGSMLVLFGLSFLYEWVWQAWSRFTRMEYLILLLILGVVAVFGYLPGVGVGLLAAVGLFVVSYSRVDVIKHILTGAEIQSRVTRPRVQRAALRESGDCILILQLQGYLFFGTANSLLDRIRQEVSRRNSASRHPIEYVLLDFRQVSGLDSTAVLSFQKMTQLAGRMSFQLILCSLTPHLQRLFVTAGVLGEGRAQEFQDLDHAVEWCESRILEGLPCAGAEDAPLAAQLEQVLPDAEAIQRLLGHFERRELAAGEYLMRQGDEPDEVFLIESGQLTAQLEKPGDEPIRLETMRGGRVVGELGFYLGIPRTAAVVADEASLVYRLSRRRLEQLAVEDSRSAAAFHQLLANLLAERTSHLIDSVNALQRT